MKVNTNISIDVELKKNAVTLFKKLGLDLSTAISLFLSQSVREQRIPFEITLKTPSKKTLSAYKEAQEMEKHNAESKTFEDVDSLMKDLLK